ncbi:MAG: ATP-binding protein [Candidatus Dormibacteria bacterium]
MSTATARTYQGTFRGRAEEVSCIRHQVAGYLGDCPVAADIVLIADELAANAVLHSRSRGQFMTVRCALSPGSVRIEVEDMGGPWRKPRDHDRPHGLDIVQALAGPGNWGTQTTSDGNRIAWATLQWPGRTEM